MFRARRSPSWPPRKGARKCEQRSSKRARLWRHSGGLEWRPRSTAPALKDCYPHTGGGCDTILLAASDSATGARAATTTRCAGATPAAGDADTAYATTTSTTPSSPHVG